MEWARVRALAADGVSQREIARRLGIMSHRGAAGGEWEPPRYRRAPRGSQLDRLEPVLRRLVEEWLFGARTTSCHACSAPPFGADLAPLRFHDLRPRAPR